MGGIELRGATPPLPDRPLLIPQTENATVSSHYVVVADDEERHRRNNSTFVTQALTNRGVHNPMVTSVSTFQDLCVQVFSGNKGIPATYVTLDNRYDYADNGEWEITRPFIQKLGEELHINAGKMQKLLEISHELNQGLKPQELFSAANSVTLCLLLRILGFTGKIVVVSSEPPSIKYIEQFSSALFEYFPEEIKEGKLPFDGCVLKNNKGPPIWCATGKKNDSQEWNMQSVADPDDDNKKNDNVFDLVLFGEQG